MLTSELIKRIESVLDSKYHFDKRDEQGNRFGEVYLDYDNIYIEEGTIINILTSENPTDAFYDFIGGLDWGCEEKYEIIQSVLKEFDDDEKDLVEDWLYDHIYIDIPYQEILDMNEVKLNISVKTEEWNYDYTLNDYYSNEEVHDESSLLWLAKQQGYTKEQLEKAVFDGETGGSKFLESVLEELNNTTSHMNRLEFFIKRPLGDVLSLLEIPQSLTIPKYVNCGLVDHWMGAGSMLDIELEKDVVIPEDMVRIEVDGANGYGVAQIFGLHYDFWR